MKSTPAGLIYKMGANGKMKNNWKECQLGDLITFQRGQDLPKTQMQGGKYPVVGSNGIIGYHNEYTTDAPSITIGRSGNVGKPFLYRGKSWSHNTSLYIKEYKNIDPIFIFYFLQTLDLSNYAGGSAVPTLNRNHIHTLIVSVPVDIEEQRKIAAVLSALDDKIELNNKINENLEQQAQAIYQSMFVSTQHETDRIGLLSELITVKYGKDHKKLNDGFFPVYGSGGIMRYVEKSLYDKESVLIPRKGSLNNVLYVDEPFWSVDTMFFTEMKMPNIAKFVFHFVKSKDLDSLNAGSAVPSMTTDILNSMKVRIPSAERLAEFEGIVAPLYRTMKENVRQSEHLSALRDTLLPKLMNGEIEV